MREDIAEEEKPSLLGSREEGSSLLTALHFLARGLPFPTVCRPCGPLASQKGGCDENSSGDVVTESYNGLPLDMLLPSPGETGPRALFGLPTVCSEHRVLGRGVKEELRCPPLRGQRRGARELSGAFRSAACSLKLVSTSLQTQNPSPERCGSQPCPPQLENQCPLTHGPQLAVISR